MHEVEISLSLSSKWFDKKPFVDVFLDDILIFSEFVVDQKELSENKLIKWKGMLADSQEHTITVNLNNKTDQDTIVDQQGNILKDMLVYIDAVQIDDIDLGFIAYKQSKFYPDRRLKPNLPEVIDEVNCFGFNGSWQLKFSVPTYLWLIEHI